MELTGGEQKIGLDLERMFAAAQSFEIETNGK